MSTQPEAFRLADRLDCGEISYGGMCKAAAELRRLHEVNQELLAALKLARSIIGHPDDTHSQHIAAIIAKAEGELK